MNSSSKNTAATSENTSTKSIIFAASLMLVMTKRMNVMMFFFQNYAADDVVQPELKRVLLGIASASLCNILYRLLTMKFPSMANRQYSNCLMIAIDQIFTRLVWNTENNTQLHFFMSIRDINWITKTFQSQDMILVWITNIYVRCAVYVGILVGESATDIEIGVFRAPVASDENIGDIAAKRQKLSYFSLHIENTPLLRQHICYRRTLKVVTIRTWTSGPGCFKKHPLSNRFYSLKSDVKFERCSGQYW